MEKKAVKDQYFCEKPIKPWIYIAIGITAFLVVWMILQRDRSFFVEQEDALPGAGTMSREWETEHVISQPVQKATQTNPYSNKNFGLAAVTKATPYRGYQFVANTSAVGFQESLKNAVNSILPVICDIHAIWTKKSGTKQRVANHQTPQFVPPFDGVIDKFIQNKGFENIGAGIIIDHRGHVLTNHHVVLNATDIVVTVPGHPSKDYHAEILAQDIQKDLAVLKLKTKDTFPEAVLGDSSFTQIGDYVIAVGSPFGMEQTVTSGIISGKRKSVSIDGLIYHNFLQTDAPINRGSSGGALVNLNGEVIGVITAIYAPTGVFNGTGFAIPINDAKDFLASALGTHFPAALDQRGNFTSIPAGINAAMTQPLAVRFGIEAIPLDPVMAREMGVRSGQGALVNRVFDNTPANTADIQRGDVITSIAGVPVKGLNDISGIVSHFKQGDSVNMRIIRRGRASEVLVRLW